MENLLNYNKVVILIKNIVVLKVEWLEILI